MNTAQILAEYQARMGWNDQSLLAILCDYIDEIASSTYAIDRRVTFDAYVEQRALDEEAMEKGEPWASMRSRLRAPLMNFWNLLQGSGFKVEDQLGPLSDGSYDYLVTSGVTELRPKMPREATWLLRLRLCISHGDVSRAHTMIHDGDTGELLVQEDLKPVEIVAKMNELADALYTKWMNSTGGI